MIFDFSQSSRHDPVSSTLTACFIFYETFFYIFSLHCLSHFYSHFSFPSIVITKINIRSYIKQWGFLCKILLINWQRKYFDGELGFVTHSQPLFVWFFWGDQSIQRSILWRKMNIVSTSTLNLHISCFTWILFLKILSLTRFQFSVFLLLWIIFMIDFIFL